jgi:hypothetical protein
MEFEGGATATFSMIAFTEAVCQRKSKIFGTLGELECDEERNLIIHRSFVDMSMKEIRPKIPTDLNTTLSGHRQEIIKYL